MSVLVQHPPTLFQQHRRTPSTPVKPSNATPGLIFLTRPIQQTQKPVQQQQLPQTPPRSSRPRSRKQDRTVSSSSSGNEDSGSSDSAAPRTPENNKARGRKSDATTANAATKKPKNVVVAKSSSSPKLSQAEAYMMTPPSDSVLTTNLRSVNVAADESSPAVVSAQPNGRVVRQRRNGHKTSLSVAGPNFPTPTTPLPLPAPRHQQQRSGSPTPIGPLSKSEPLASNMRAPRRRVSNQQKPSPLPDWDMPAAFEDNTPPPSPTESSKSSNSGNELTWQQALFTNSNSSFPEPPVTPPRHANRRPVKHQRSPSFPVEALFNMSLEEDSFGGSPVSLPFNARRAVDKFAYAGPTFHNSPNASALPAPKFLD